MNPEIVAVVVVAFTVIFVLYISKARKPWITGLLNWFPAILFAYVIPAAVTHGFRWDMSNVYLHSLSRFWIIPIALISVMSALPLRQLLKVGIKPLILFVGGSLFIATLPVALVKISASIFTEPSVLFYGQGYWKGLVPIVGSWIGGSTSQLILKELAETPENLFLSVLVLDNILVNIWTILMFQFIKHAAPLSVKFGITDPIPETTDMALGQIGKRIHPVLVGLTFVGIAAIGNFLSLGFFQVVVGLSIAGILLGNMVPGWNSAFSLKMGGISIVLVMAILGLRLNFSNLMLPGVFVYIVLIWLILHFFGMLAIARLMKINLIWVPIASMANLGGISTAPAVTAAFREDLMPHAVLLALLSMVTGTGWGIFTIFLFQNL